MQAEQQFFIGIQDVGKGNRITNKALLEAMTNTTNLHGNMAGQSIEDKATSRMSWVVLNWKLQVFFRPKVCETITVKTWAQAYTPIQAHRDFDVLDANGERIAMATSVWVAVDTEHGSLVHLTAENMGPYGPEKEHQNFPGFKFHRPAQPAGEALASMPFRICKSMIDGNDHVHNPAYLDLASEVLPPPLDSVLFDNVEVCYKKETKPGETVRLEYYKEDDMQCVLVKEAVEEGLHAMILQY